MSLWTDRELKALIAKVNILEARVNFLESTNKTKMENMATESAPPDKRTKEYREWKNANS